MDGEREVCFLAASLGEGEREVENGCGVGELWLEEGLNPVDDCQFNHAPQVVFSITPKGSFFNI